MRLKSIKCHRSDLAKYIYCPLGQWAYLGCDKSVELSTMEINSSAQSWWVHTYTVGGFLGVSGMSNWNPTKNSWTLRRKSFVDSLSVRKSNKGVGVIFKRVCSATKDNVSRVRLRGEQNRCVGGGSFFVWISCTKFRAWLKPAADKEQSAIISELFSACLNKIKFKPNLANILTLNPVNRGFNRN